MSIIRRPERPHFPRPARDLDDVDRDLRLTRPKLAAATAADDSATWLVVWSRIDSLLDERLTLMGARP